MSGAIAKYFFAAVLLYYAAKYHVIYQSHCVMGLGLSSAFYVTQAVILFLSLAWDGDEHSTLVFIVLLALTMASGCQPPQLPTWAQLAVSLGICVRIIVHSGNGALVTTSALFGLLSALVVVYSGVICAGEIRDKTKTSVSQGLF